MSAFKSTGQVLAGESEHTLCQQKLTLIVALYV
jgi:hypothetical protein